MFSRSQNSLIPTSYVTLPVTQPIPDRRASLSQPLSGAAAGDTWYLSVHFNTSAYTGSGCHMLFGTDLEALTSRDYYNNGDPTPPTGRIYAAGIFQFLPSAFYFTYACDSDGGGVTRRQVADVWGQFDDMSLTFESPP